MKRNRQLSTVIILVALTIILIPVSPLTNAAFAQEWPDWLNITIATEKSNGRTLHLHFKNGSNKSKLKPDFVPQNSAECKTKLLDRIFCQNLNKPGFREFYDFNRMHKIRYSYSILAWSNFKENTFRFWLWDYCNIPLSCTELEKNKAGPAPTGVFIPPLN